MKSKKEYYRERIEFFIKSISDRCSAYLNGIDVSKRRRVLVCVFIICMVILLLQMVIAYFKLVNKI